MIKVENIDVYGFEAAIRGMRNPMNSWDKSDSSVCADFKTVYEDGRIGCGHTCPKWSPDTYCGYSEHLEKYPYDYYMIGKNDLDLMCRLYNAGTEHSKYSRYITVTMDITAPFYWWKEFSTYKFIAPDPMDIDINSCSTMHKIAAKEFELDDFSHEHLSHNSEKVLNHVIKCMNDYREEFLKDKEKHNWWQMIQLLPSSYNQRRTVKMSYATVFDIIRQRTGHKLTEWVDFVAILKDLPYVKEIICD